MRSESMGTDMLNVSSRGWIVLQTEMRKDFPLDVERSLLPMQTVM